MQDYLSYDEIVEVLSESKYAQLYMGDILPILGKQDILKRLQESGIDSSIEFKEGDVFENSGIWYLDKGAHPLLVELAGGSGYCPSKPKFFHNKEELREFLDKYLNSYSRNINYDVLYSSTLAGDTESMLMSQMGKLSAVQKSSLIVYKTRMFQVMNKLWEEYQTSSAVDLEKIEKVLSKEGLSQIEEFWLTDKEKKVYQEEKNMRRLIKDQLAFFRKAKANPENARFFDSIPDLDLSTEMAFVSSVVKYMGVMEGIREITAPEDLRLYRGVYGTANPESLGRSMMSSCTPVLDTAIKFAKQHVGGTWSEGHNSLMIIDVKKGTSCIPLMFSVKTSINGVDPEIAMARGIDYDKLSDDAIKLEVVKSENIQSEILLNESMCQIPSMSELSDGESMTLVETQAMSLLDSVIIKVPNLMQELAVQDALARLGNFRNSSACTSWRRGYSHTLYAVSVMSRDFVHDEDAMGIDD